MNTDEHGEEVVRCDTGVLARVGAYTGKDARVTSWQFLSACICVHLRFN